MIPFCVIIAAIPFIILQSYIRIPADAAWLTQAAEHVLNGQGLSEYYFDTNPPMSFWVYIPVALLKMLGLSTWNALQLYAVSLSIFSILGTSYYLRKLHASDMLHNLIIIFFAFALFFLPVSEYGQKDHLIGIALLPFLLAQLCITKDIKSSVAINIVTLLIWTPFILIKPHYGLLPAAIIAHRFFKTRSLKIILNVDFIILALCTLGYIASVFAFYPDFIKDVLPLSLNTYVTAEQNESIHKFAFAIGIFALCLIGAALSIEDKSNNKSILTLLCVSTFLSVIPYWVQGKGFTLHLIPYGILGVTSIGALGGYYFTNAIKANKVPTALITLAVFVVSVFTVYSYSKTKSHDIYRDHELLKIIKPTGNEKSFYIESNSTNDVMQLSEYNDIEYASRFVVNWFTFQFPGMEKSQMQYYWDLTGRYFAEDLERYKPETIMLIDIDDRLSILHAYREHPDFQDALAQYKQTDTYESGTLFMNSKKVLGKERVSYKVYKRINESN